MAYQLPGWILSLFLSSTHLFRQSFDFSWTAIDISFTRLGSFSLHFQQRWCLHRLQQLTQPSQECGFHHLRSMEFECLHSCIDHSTTDSSLAPLPASIYICFNPSISPAMAQSGVRYLPLYLEWDWYCSYTVYTGHYAPSISIYPVEIISKESPLEMAL